MKTCDQCNMRLWSTDKGVCPGCKPEENRLVYGLKPLANIIEEPKKEVRKILIQKVNEETTCCTMSETLADAVKNHVLNVYERHGKHKTKTAKALNVTIKTLYNHLDRYGVM